MKRLAILACVLLTACTSTRFEANGVKVSRVSFMQRVEIGNVSISTNGLASLSQYHNDGGSVALAALASAVVSLSSIAVTNR